MSEGREFEVSTFKNGLTRIISDEGEIDFYFDKKSGKWNIDDLMSSAPGLGKRLVAEFVKTCGKNQIVEALITEEETRKTLESVGYFSRARDNMKDIAIDNQEFLETLKIVKVLKGGGITTDRLILEPKPDEQKTVVVILEGRT